MKWNIIENDIWTLVQPDDLCLEKDIDKENRIETSTIEECASKCGGFGSHFAFGTNEFGGQGCHNGLCKCHCIEICKKLDQENYWFFRFKSGVDFSINGK